ncbi:hypothetical protein L6164_019726 [Bauhinia variegata]|uniref:Uncharacterized protein n=1 Tax=Bauhinia variegata TaxID=167791 RepID=A0ACB9MW75_BAUVA|nr:hypothetical protein L6164_019726 [Bauhinia variegata]
MSLGWQQALPSNFRVAHIKSKCHLACNAKRHEYGSGPHLFLFIVFSHFVFPDSPSFSPCNFNSRRKGKPRNSPIDIGGGYRFYIKYSVHWPTV